LIDLYGTLLQAAWIYQNGMFIKLNCWGVNLQFGEQMMAMLMSGKTGACIEVFGYPLVLTMALNLNVNITVGDTQIVPPDAHIFQHIPPTLQHKLYATIHTRALKNMI
jgi:hypothetical protein